MVGPAGAKGRYYSRGVAGIKGEFRLEKTVLKTRLAAFPVFVVDTCGRDTESPSTVPLAILSSVVQCPYGVSQSPLKKA